MSVTGELIGQALALGAREVPEWTAAEETLARSATQPFAAITESTRGQIRQGADPLGDAFCRVFTAEERRPKGATYTPLAVVDAMLAWAVERVRPARVVDPGAGSARFLVAAGRRFPGAELVAIEIDPLATILARGHLAAGFAERARSPRRHSAVSPGPPSGARRPRRSRAST